MQSNQDLHFKRHYAAMVAIVTSWLISAHSSGWLVLLYKTEAASAWATLMCVVQTEALQHCWCSITVNPYNYWSQALMYLRSAMLVSQLKLAHFSCMHQSLLVLAMRQKLEVINGAEQNISGL